jgi:hypothetical protein
MLQVASQARQLPVRGAGLAPLSARAPLPPPAEHPRSERLLRPAEAAEVQQIPPFSCSQW